MGNVNLIKKRVPWNKGKVCPQISAYLKGRTLSQETKNKIRKAHLGKPLSEAHKQKIKKHHLINHHRYWLGRKQTEESNEKRRASQIGSR